MTTTGHEDEFRRLFESEAETRLAELGEQALELESRGRDPELVNAMFRNAHTLKGGAGVVGLKDVVIVVHELEQLIEDLRAGSRDVTRGLADAVLATVDALREMITVAVEGGDTQGAADRARQALAGIDEDAPPAPRSVVPPRPPAPVPARRSPPAAPKEPRRRREDARDAIPVPLARLDELVRLVGEGAAAHLRVGRLLTERLGAEPAAIDEYRDLARVLDQLHAQAMRARMVSVVAVAGALRRAVRDIANATGKEVRWELAGEETELDRHVLERLREPLVALVRNAIDHGIEPPEERAAAGKDPAGHVLVHAMQVGSEVIITVSDDGRGIDTGRVAEATGQDLTSGEALDRIFRPGVTTASTVTGLSGRGVGLDEVRQAVDDLRGTVTVHTVPGEGTEFRISVPITLAILRCLLVDVRGERFAIPMPAIVALVDPKMAGRISAEGRPAVWVTGDAVPLSDLGAVLGIPGGTARGPVVVLSTPSGRHAFDVDELAGQRDVVVKDLGRVLPRIGVLAGASIEPDGGVLLVLDAGGLLEAAGTTPAAHRNGDAGTEIDAPVRPALPRGRATVLVVDDALTIRELQRSILERAGYVVHTAASGREALERLGKDAVDLIVTDVEMPGMDGLELARLVRDRADISQVPILVLTSRATESDRQAGIQAGADAYLVKSAFDEHTLLTAVARLLEEPA